MNRVEYFYPLLYVPGKPQNIFRVTSPHMRVLFYLVSYISSVNYKEITWNKVFHGTSSETEALEILSTLAKYSRLHFTSHWILMPRIRASGSLVYTSSSATADAILLLSFCVNKQCIKIDPVYSALFGWERSLFVSIFKELIRLSLKEYYWQILPSSAKEQIELEVIESTSLMKIWHWVRDRKNPWD